MTRWVIWGALEGEVAWEVLRAEEVPTSKKTLICQWGTHQRAEVEGETAVVIAGIAIRDLHSTGYCSFLSSYDFGLEFNPNTEG